MTVSSVLVLDADWTPLRVVTWQRAVVLLLEEKVSMVETYADRAIRSASAVFPRPAVVVLRRYHGMRGRVRFNRQNVLARDGYACQYCGVRPVRPSGRPDLSELTLDHVVPRSRSAKGKVRTADGQVVGVTSWSNVVACCVPCNSKKAARTPEEAKMPLRVRPRVPTGFDRLWMAVRTVEVPEEWRDWLPAQSPWKGYWTDELDE
ncbi:MAG: HNH endonuclease [Alphaproteobacteria bacterium]|nr:HNH endonuclease [Alphaproteobacteria bacterium]